MNSRRMGTTQMVHTVENVEHLRQAFLCSPNHSAWGPATEFRIGNHSVRHILQEELHFLPFQIGHWATVETQRTMHSGLTLYAR